MAAVVVVEVVGDYLGYSVHSAGAAAACGHEEVSDGGSESVVVVAAVAARDDEFVVEFPCSSAFLASAGVTFQASVLID